MEQTLHNAFKRFSLGDALRAYTCLLYTSRRLLQAVADGVGHAAALGAAGVDRADIRPVEVCLLYTSCGRTRRRRRHFNNKVSNF